MMWVGRSLDYSADDLDFWAKPFRFTIENDGGCVVAIKNLVMLLPLSRDPRLPIAKHLVIKPSQFTMRPDFTTKFD